MRLKIVLCGLLMMTVLLAFTTTQAIDVISLEIIHVDWYYPEAFRITTVLTNPVLDPPSDSDISWITLVDCQGALIGFHIDSYGLADGPDRINIVTIPLASLNPITGRQVIARLYDTPDAILYYSIEELYTILQTYPLKATASVDMGESYPECPPPDEPTPDPEEIPSFDDGRLNVDSGAPIVMYNVNGSFQIYKVGDNSAGLIALVITAEELAALETPAENTEITRSVDNSVVVYKLSSGEIQVNTAPDNEGKVFVYILSADLLSLIQSSSYIA